MSNAMVPGEPDDETQDGDGSSPTGATGREDDTGGTSGAAGTHESAGSSNPPVGGTDTDVTSGNNEDTDLPRDQQTVVDDVPEADASDDAPEDRSVMPGDAPEEEIEAERADRLDPDNRPDDAEIDNTNREFDSEKGMFTDSDGYGDAEPKFPAEGTGA